MLFTATLAPTGTAFPASDEQSLLKSMRAAGVGPHGCHGGGCGVCKVRILEGSYEQFKRMSRAKVSAAEQAEGYVLACCVKPSGDIVFEEAR